MDPEAYGDQSSASLQRILVERDRQIEDLIEHAWDPIFICQVDATVLRVNRACEEQSGYSRTDLVGRSALDVLMPAGQRAVAEYMAKLLTKQPVPSHIEVDLRHKDGSVVPGEAAMRPIYEPDGTRIREIHCICRILTERRELEQRRIAEARLQTAIQLASGAAHELFQPLTGIFGLVDILATEAKGDSGRELRKSLATLRDLATRMREIVDRMKTLAEFKTAAYPGGEKIADLRKTK